nr:hypothetical protein [Tanacetum cinerariifolium]GFA66928.1 hypothetical protein [Tanacetum cinerariifolium]
MKEKGDECIFVGYSNQSKAYRVFNNRTRVIMESIHINFYELPLMASDQNSSDPAPEYRTVTTSNELDLLFSSMFDELLNGSSKVVSKSSAVSVADAPNQRQNYTTPLNNHTTPAPTIQIHQSPLGIFINQAKYAQEILVKHGMTSCDGIGTQMPKKHLDIDLSGTPVDQMKYRSGDKLVSWSSKKQDCTLMSSAEAEYMSLSACCA